MAKIKIFLASSSELEGDRLRFENYVNRKNKKWHDRGVFLELVIWEDFLDALSRKRLQDEYNKAIRECDLFVMLFHTKVGKYTREEFETAFGQFKKTNKPLIYTYFKDAAIADDAMNKEDMLSLSQFMDQLKRLGHFYSVYRNIDELKFKFNDQLDKLADSGFIQFKPIEDPDRPMPAATTKVDGSVRDSELRTRTEGGQSRTEIGKDVIGSTITTESTRQIK